MSKKYRFDAEEVRDNCVNWLKELGEQERFSKAVLGISGGKDSTIAAALCCRAFGNDNVHGILMPNKYQIDFKDSLDVCKRLEISYHIANIGKVYQTLIEAAGIGITPEAKINIAPRLRMAILYAWGQSYGYRVCGTSNASELLVGYCTKYGDMASDFNPLANLTTVEVIGIGDTMSELSNELVHKTPHDGLCGKSDEDNLGISYLDIHNYIRGTGEVSADVRNEIEKRSRATNHKRVPIPTFQYGI